MIFLHGINDTALGYLDLFKFYDMCPKNCRIVLPTAPKAPVTCNDGKVMNSWFDVKSIPFEIFPDPIPTF